MKRLQLIGILMTLAAAVNAHPGHGYDNPLSPGHYVGNPEHSIPITLAIGAAVILVVKLAYKFSKK